MVIIRFSASLEGKEFMKKSKIKVSTQFWYLSAFAQFQRFFSDHFAKKRFEKPSSDNITQCGPIFNWPIGRAFASKPPDPWFDSGSGCRVIPKTSENKCVAKADFLLQN